MSAFRPRGIATTLLLVLSAVLPCCRREAPSAAGPGSLAVSASLEPAEISIGDLARLRVTVDHPAEGTLELPEFGQGKAIVVSDRKQTTVRLEDEREAALERTTVDALLTSFEPGEHRIGAGMVTHTGRGGKTVATSFPETALRTKSVLSGEGTPPREIKGPVRWPAPLLSWAGLAGGLMALAVAVWFGVRARRRARGTPVPAAGSPPPSPHEQALKALAALRGRELIQTHQVEPFYRELSAIVRRYIEERFGLRAPERTTEEFIREATGSGLLAEPHRELVQRFLEQCDLVKFARLRPFPADMTLAFEAAVRLVRETRQQVGP